MIIIIIIIIITTTKAGAMVERIPLPTPHLSPYQRIGN